MTTTAAKKTPVVIMRIVVAATLVRGLLLLGYVPIEWKECLLENDGLRSILIHPVFTFEHVQQAEAIRRLSSSSSSSFSSSSSSSVSVQGGSPPPPPPPRFVDAYPVVVVPSATSGGTSSTATGASTTRRTTTLTHIPPLLLALMEPIVQYYWKREREQSILCGLFVWLVDACIALCLIRLARCRILRVEQQRQQQDPRRQGERQQQQQPTAAAHDDDKEDDDSMDSNNNAAATAEDNVDNWEVTLETRMPQKIQPKYWHVFYDEPLLPQQQGEQEQQQPQRHQVEQQEVAVVADEELTRSTSRSQEQRLRPEPPTRTQQQEQKTKQQQPERHYSAEPPPAAAAVERGQQQQSSSRKEEEQQNELRQREVVVEIAPLPHDEPPLLPVREIPVVAATAYYASPVTILAGTVQGGGSFQNLPVLLVLLSLVVVVEEHAQPPQRKRGGGGNGRNSSTKNGDDKKNNNKSTSLVWPCLCVALAMYVQVRCAVYVIPLVLLLWTSSPAAASPPNNKIMSTNNAVRYVVMLSLIVLLSACLQLFSWLLVGNSGDDEGRDDSEKEVATYRTIVMGTHGYALFSLRGHDGIGGTSIVTPSLSLLWYFAMELFDRFLPFFTLLLAALPYTLILPLTIRLYRYPMVLVAIFWMLDTMFRPTQTLYDLQVGLCLMLCNPKSLARMQWKVSVVALCGLGVPVGLYLVDYDHMWLQTNTGEANYVFFQTVIYNVLLSIVLLDFVSASLRRDKALRLTEKHIVQRGRERGRTTSKNADDDDGGLTGRKN